MSWTPNCLMLLLSRRPSTLFTLFLAVTCSKLSPPTNGELLGCNTAEMLYNTVCRSSCKEGFEAKGSVARRCTENGTWSGTDLVCTGNYYCIVIIAYSNFQVVFYNKLWVVGFLFAAAKCWWCNSRSNWLVRPVVLHEATQIASHTFCWLSVRPKNWKRPQNVIQTLKNVLENSSLSVITRALIGYAGRCPPGYVNIAAYFLLAWFWIQNRKRPRVVHKTKSQYLSQSCENLEF